MIVDSQKFTCFFSLLAEFDNNGSGHLRVITSPRPNFDRSMIPSLLRA